MKKFVILCLCCALVLPLKASAYGSYADDNPFVEAMLRMMEIFGLIDRSSLPLQVPYLPGAGGLTGFSSFPGTSPMYGLTGVPGMSPMYGLTGVPGMSPVPGMGGIPGMSPMPGMGGVPGMSPVPGMGGIPGMSPMPGMGGVPGMSTMPGMSGGGFPGTAGNQAGYGGYAWGSRPYGSALLDGAWELDKGGSVIIRGAAARLYLTREKYQDFNIGYDRQYLWWSPQTGGSPSRYRYRMREGRMILADEDGKLLLLRRRR